MPRRSRALAKTAPLLAGIMVLGLACAVVRESGVATPVPKRLEQDPQLATAVQAGLARTAGGLDGRSAHSSYRLVTGVTVTDDLLAVGTSLPGAGDDARQRAVLVCRMVNDYLQQEPEFAGRLKRISVFGASRTLLSYKDGPDAGCQ